MKLYKDKINYFEEQNFNIFICNVIISYVNNKHISKIKKQPSLLKKYQLDITVNDVMLVLTTENIIPSKDMHDRKIKTFLRNMGIKQNDQNSYWISKIEKIKEIGDTKHGN